MKKTAYIFILLFSFIFLQNCEEDYLTPDLNYVTFEAPALDLGVDPAGSGSLEVTVYASSITSSARTVELNVSDATSLDASAFTAPASVTIPANSNVGTFTVDVNGSAIGDGGNLVLGFGASSSGDFIGDDLTIAVFPVCFANTQNLTLTLAIEFDSWPEEIYWVLEDGSGVVAESATPAAYGAYAGMTGSISLDFCLPNGDYTFTIYDGYGDGGGPYSLTFSDGSVVHNSDGGYGTGEAIPFSI